MSDSVGLFGLGLVGQALTQRLVGAGYAVLGADPNPDARARFAELGGTPVDPGEVWQAKTILTAVFDTTQLAGILNAAPVATGATVISTSTCDPDEMPALAADAATREITLIEAPLSGTSKDLANGNALFLVAGDAAACTAQAPVIDALGRGQHYVGAIGQGNRAKLAINLVLGLNRAALAEGLVFAKALGLDPATFLPLLQDSAANSAVMASKGPLMGARNFHPLGRIAQSAKDFNLIRDQAAKAGHTLPFADTYQRMVDDGIAQGEGDIDNSGILLAIERATP